MINRTINIAVVEELANQDVREFLKKELSGIISDPFRDDILMAHIHPLLLEERGPLLIQKINQIINL